MPNWRFTDDSSSDIAYSGSWVRQIGSDRQWSRGISSTFEVGATATFRFRGTGVQVYGTVPAGPSTVRSTYTIDNGSPISVERPCGSAIGYAQPFFDQQSLSEGEHVLVITNVGSEVDFRLDRIDWLPSAKDLASATPLPPQGPTVFPPPVSTPAIIPAPGNSPPDDTDNLPPDAIPPTDTTTSPVANTPPNINSLPNPDTVTHPEINSAAGTKLQAIISTFTSGDKLLLTTVSPPSTYLAVSTDASGREVTATMIVMVSDGSTTTVGVTSTSSPGAEQIRIANRLSKGALGGIVAGSLVFAFAFLFLLVWFLRRVRRRRQFLEYLAASDSPNARLDMKQTRSGTTGNAHFTPFHLTDHSSSSEGLIAGPGYRTRVVSTQRTSSVHKSPLVDSITDLNGESNTISRPLPSASSRPQTADTTLRGTDRGNLVPQSLPATLHRRRPTSFTIIADTPFVASAVPPPSYASLDVSVSGREHWTMAIAGDT